MSPFLSLGCLSPRTAWHSMSSAVSKAPPSAKRSKPPVSLLGQLIWREFNNLKAHSANTQGLVIWDW